MIITPLVCDEADVVFDVEPDVVFDVEPSSTICAVPVPATAALVAGTLVAVLTTALRADVSTAPPAVAAGLDVVRAAAGVGDSVLAPVDVGIDRVQTGTNT